jgi:hypothetical protein
MDSLIPGQEVEVHFIWAAGRNGAYKQWAKGYRFVRYDGDSVIVENTGGLYKGIPVRYSKQDVRPAM